MPLTLTRPLLHSRPRPVVVPPQPPLPPLTLTPAQCSRMLARRRRRRRLFARNVAASSTPFSSTTTLPSNSAQTTTASRAMCSQLSKWTCLSATTSRSPRPRRLPLAPHRRRRRPTHHTTLKSRTACNR